MRLRGLGLGKVGMEKLKFSHRVLFTRAFEEFGLDGDGENLWPLRVGKAGLGMKKIFHDD